MAWCVCLQVIAVSCQGTTASSPASKDIKIVEAPAIVVTMTLGGSLTAEQVTPEVEQQLENAVAESLGISPALIQIQSVKNARRRLLALAVTFRILAANATDAAALQKKATTTDFTSAIKKQTGLDIQVSGISADVVSSPTTVPIISPAPGGSSSGNVTVIAAAVGAVGGVLLLGAVLLFVYVRKSGRWQRYKSTTTDKVEEFANISDSTGDDQAEQVRHHTVLFVYLYIYMYVYIYIYIYIIFDTY